MTVNHSSVGIASTASPYGGLLPWGPPSGAPFRASWRGLFSFEVFFLLFLFAGVYKAAPLFSALPIDLTAVFLGISAVTGGCIIAKHRLLIQTGAAQLLFLWLAFLTYYTATLLWTPGSDYALAKVLLLWGPTTWALVGASCVIASSPARLERLSWVMLAFAIVAGIRVVESFLRYGPMTFLTEMSTDYLTFGQVIGAGAIVAYVAAVYSRKSLPVKVLLSLTIVFFAFILSVLGGRGPFLALCAALLLPFVLSVRVSADRLTIRRNILYAAAFLCAAAAVVAVWSRKADLGLLLDRLNVLTEAGMGESAGSRLDYYRTALALLSERPVFGHGVGSWPLLVGLPDGRAYPHNMLLEVAVEGGAVGIFLLSLLFWQALRLSRPFSRSLSHPMKLIALLSLTYYFFNAMFSGDLPDNRYLFVFVGLAAARPFVRGAPSVPAPAGGRRCCRT